MGGGGGVRSGEGRGEGKEGGKEEVRGGRETLFLAHYVWRGGGGRGRGVEGVGWRGGYFRRVHYSYVI